jgi:hypothetical protein
MKPPKVIRDDQRRDAEPHVVGHESRAAGSLSGEIVPSASAEEVGGRLALWLSDVSLEAASQREGRPLPPVVKRQAS